MGETRPIEDDISQDRQAQLLTSTGNGPTVDTEEELLAAEFGPANADGVYGAPADNPGAGDGPRQLGKNTGGQEEMIQAMESRLGMGEPNLIQEWYRDRNGNAYSGNFPWCDAGVTNSAYNSDNYEAVCFGTDYAYTVAHAARFNQAKLWTPMTNGILKSGIRRGDVIFFDWDGSSNIGAIDHVGVVTSVSTDGTYVFTVECNTANVCARRVRVVHDIAGYGRPKYTPATGVTASTPARYTVTINGLKYGYGATGDHITAVRAALGKKGFTKHTAGAAGSAWGDADTENYSDFQKSRGLKGTKAGQDADGVPGASTLTVLLGKLPAPAKKPTPKPVYEPFPGEDFFHAGRHSDVITAMGRRLVLMGCSHYASGPGPNWTNADKASYAAWQRKLGYTGVDANGIPGKASWDQLRIPKV